MEISEIEQLDSDFDWFCVDLTGQIGHFASAGYKRVPRSVAASGEDLQFVTNYFRNDAPFRGGYCVSKDFAKNVPGLKDEEKYLRDYVAMADRGLYSFDIESHVREGIAYFLVAIPEKPLLIGDLPLEVREIVGRTVISGRLLQTTLEIGYEETLGW